MAGLVIGHLEKYQHSLTIIKNRSNNNKIIIVKLVIIKK